MFLSTLGPGLLVAGACAGGPRPEAAAARGGGGVRVEVAASFLHGEVDGFLQIPRGGQPGSSSRHRPALGEMGIDHVAALDVGGSVEWRRSRVRAGARFVPLRGRATLTRDRVSGKVTFPAGTSVRGALDLDWYHLTYERRFVLDEDARGRRLTLRPGFGVAVLDFDYELHGPGLVGTRRAFTKWALRLGATARWELSDELSLQAHLLRGLPIGMQPRLSTMGLRGRYRLWRGRSSAAWASVGVAYDEISFEDEQTLPNRIEARLGPMLLVGLQVRF
ncbi:MAG: hypothetical protein ACE5JG_06695 [Planctomycetota bacterium]